MGITTTCKVFCFFPFSKQTSQHPVFQMILTLPKVAQANIDSSNQMDNTVPT